LFNPRGPSHGIEIIFDLLDYTCPQPSPLSAYVVQVPGPPGTMILFSIFTPHASAPNLSYRPRPSKLEEIIVTLRSLGL
jgi:hypothetical protein